MAEQTAQTGGEDTQAGDTLVVDTSTPSAPEKIADAIPADAGLLDHVSVL